MSDLAERAAKLIREFVGARVMLSRDGHACPLCEGDEELVAEALRRLAESRGEAELDEAFTIVPVAQRVRHVKRGSTYAVLGRVTAQVSTAEERGLRDYDELIVYRADDDGRLWVRFPDEMEDGRFETIAPKGKI